MSWENNYIQFKSKENLDSMAASQLRTDSFDRFLKSGLPTRKEEAWKYTSLNNFKQIEWKSGNDEVHLSALQMQEISKKIPAEFYNIVFINGKLNFNLSDEIPQVQLNELTSLDFNQSEKHVEVNLLNLANAFLSKKVVIHVNKNQIVDKPLQILMIQTSPSSTFYSEKINIKIDENAELTLIMHTMSFESSQPSALNVNTTIAMADSAKVKFIQLQNQDLNSFHFSQTEVILNSNSQFQSLAMSVGSVLTRNYFHLNFLGRHSFAGVDGLTTLNSKQHVDNYTYIQHFIGENQSVQHYKSILSGSAQSVFRGRVRIEPDAQKANSEQLNNNLLLTREAQANSIPQLEIYADDVKAGHGSTIGQLNKEEIFYFLSRGINQYEAVKMLSYGYAKELVLKFENQVVQNFLMATLQDKLERMIQND